MSVRLQSSGSRDDMLVDGLDQPDDSEGRDSGPLRTRELLLEVEDVDLPATLTVPDRASGLVIFAHGSGSSRWSPRNLAVAQALQRAGLATLLFDMLAEAETAVTRTRFHVTRLAHRLLATTRWAATEALRL